MKSPLPLLWMRDGGALGYIGDRTMLAFGTTAPVESVTVPKIEPKTACPKADGAIKHAQPKGEQTTP